MIQVARAWLMLGGLIACSRTDSASTPPDHAGAPHSTSSPVAKGGEPGVALPMNAEQPREASTPPEPKREPLPVCTETTGQSLALGRLTRDQVRTRFGSPDQQESFRVEERQGEFYGPIANTYPTTDPKNRSVRLEQWTWRAGDCVLTVWFHRPQDHWEVLDDFYWHKDAAF